MGIYLNPGNENFKEITKAPLYVDKTMMIQTVNQFIDTGNKYVCVSRPRRFGKTVTGNRGYNNEDALQSAIYLAYIYAMNHYAVIREMTSGKGFADVVFILFKDDYTLTIIEGFEQEHQTHEVIRLRPSIYVPPSLFCVKENTDHF